MESSHELAPSFLYLWEIIHFSIIQVNWQEASMTNLEQIEEARKRREALLAALEGITYDEWWKLSLTVNRYFEGKEKELKRQLQLSGVEELRKLTL